MRNELEVLDIFGRPLKVLIDSLGKAADAAKALDEAMASRMTEVSKASTAPKEELSSAATTVGVHEGFVLGPISQNNLKGVHPLLIGVVKQAIELTVQDFRVYEGVRAIEQQRLNVKRGVSQTMDSKHLIQSDGYAHAVDLVPLIGGIPKWDWEGCYKIAFAMTHAASMQQCAGRIRWGGIWDRVLSQISKCR
jgi:peptidoglycan L-alanyl-D-glutamate endopeptidase CwlK